MTALAGKLRIALVSATAIAAIGGAAAPAASAGLLVTTAQSCDANVLSQPFSTFGDQAWYTQVPGGSFERGSQAWTLTGGAKIVSGNESWFVRSKKDSLSLSIPAGGTATSPSMCVGLSEPTLRYFAKQAGSLLGLTGAMSVEVLTETSLGDIVAAPLLPGALTTSWTASAPTPVVANLLPLLPDQKTAVAFRFRADTGNWGIDDVYVDPYRSH